jgi:N-carbamoylputrescine amidase
MVSDLGYTIKEQTMNGAFKAAAVQMDCRVGDVKGNVEKACHFIEEAAGKGAKLVGLPEMFNTGYFSYTDNKLDAAYWDLAETLNDSWTIRTIAKVAKGFGLYVVVPFFEKKDYGIYYNSAALVDPLGEVIGCYRKVHLPFSFSGCEKFYFRPGYEFPVFYTALGRIGIQICFDRDFPEGYRILALKGADIVVHPNGAPRRLAELWRILMRVRAYENGIFILGVSLTGNVGDTENEFVGNSLLINPIGELVAVMDFEEGILISEINLNDVEKARRWRFGRRDRRPEVYGKITDMI